MTIPIYIFCCVFCRYQSPSWDFQFYIFTYNIKAPPQQALGHSTGCKNSRWLSNRSDLWSMSEADWNIALTRKWLLLCSQLDSKHSFAARLTLYAMPQTSSQLQKHSVVNGNNSQCFFCALENINNILRGRNVILHSIISQQMINQTTGLIVLHTWSSYYLGCWTYSVKVLETPRKKSKENLLCLCSVAVVWSCPSDSPDVFHPCLSISSNPRKTALPSPPFGQRFKNLVRSYPLLAETEFFNDCFSSGFLTYLSICHLNCQHLSCGTCGTGQQLHPEGDQKVFWSIMSVVGPVGEGQRNMLNYVSTAASVYACDMEHLDTVVFSRKHQLYECVLMFHHTRVHTTWTLGHSLSFPAGTDWIRAGKVLSSKIVINDK